MTGASHAVGPAPGTGRSPAQRLIAALQELARGRPDCGRPINGEDARQLARSALIDAGLDWPRAERGGAPR